MTGAVVKILKRLLGGNNVAAFALLHQDDDDKEQAGEHVQHGEENT